VFCAFRAAGKSLGIFHWARHGERLRNTFFIDPSERGVYRFSTISSRLPFTFQNSVISRLELRSSVIPTCVTRYTMELSSKSAFPLEPNLDPASTTT